MAEEQIECYGVKVYSLPGVFGVKQLVEAREKVGRQVKLGISWDGSTRHLDVRPPTNEDINRLGSMQITCKETYSPYSLFGTSTRKFKQDKPCLGTGRVNIVWTNEKIQEWRQRLGYVILNLVKDTF